MFNFLKSQFQAAGCICIRMIEAPGPAKNHPGWQLESKNGGSEDFDRCRIRNCRHRMANKMMRFGLDLAPEGSPGKKNLLVGPSNFVRLKNHRPPLFAAQQGLGNSVNLRQLFCPSKVGGFLGNNRNLSFVDETEAWTPHQTLAADSRTLLLQRAGG